jgi:hypothetical protein
LRRAFVAEPLSSLLLLLRGVPVRVDALSDLELEGGETVMVAAKELELELVEPLPPEHSAPQPIQQS